MKTVFLAWQHTRPEPGLRSASRAWFPIGRLDRTEDNIFHFAYTQGAERAKREAGFAPLASFPDLKKTYEAPELFSVFRNRVMQATREDYPAYLAQMGLADGVADPLEIMAISGGNRQTDHLEVFPKIQKSRDGRFSCRFFLHGWRHANEHAKARVAQLQEGELLSLALELKNPVTQDVAVQLQTANDYHMIGWTPRYLIQDLLAAMAQCPGCLQARVARFNPEPAPYTQRVLVHLEGILPAEIEPMSGPDFQPLN